MARRAAELIRVSIEPVLDITTVFGVSLLLVGGYYLTETNPSDYIATLFVYVLAFLRAKPFLKYFNEMRARLLELIAYLDRAGDFLRTDNKKFTNVGSDTDPEFRNQITFDQIYFQYSTDTDPVLRNVCFEIQKNKATAIVGETGSGKSTILDLILGLIHPSEGQILIDNLPLSSLNLRSWRARIGVVDQSITLSGETIEEVIRFGKPHATHEEIQRAAKEAHAHEFIKEMEKGYQTPLGDRGFGLSGGQQQRLALARALIRNPEILILDEATSALDVESEELIRSTLLAIEDRVTVIMVAHRLSTIRNADKVIVVENGKVVEVGSVNQLRESGGKFSKMWDLR